MAKPQPGVSARFTCPAWTCPLVTMREEATCPYRREKDEGRRAAIRAACIETQIFVGGGGDTPSSSGDQKPTKPGKI
ncbi:hypothetical protein [Paraburkholderia tropica]|uniref:hypothetical protein n=1 Tax=Paraburkholderia tropica TaxID=92647 RepID=UPI002AAFDA1B|nr:hypothetical protein [Paraburkholderia tropica]